MGSFYPNFHLLNQSLIYQIQKMKAFTLEQMGKARDTGQRSTQLFSQSFGAVFSLPFPLGVQATEEPGLGSSLVEIPTPFWAAVQSNWRFGCCAVP